MSKLLKNIDQSNKEIGSPDYLGHIPGKPLDIKRISRKPLFWGFCALSVVLIAVVYTLNVKAAAVAQKNNEQESTVTVEASDSKHLEAFLAKKPQEGMISPEPKPNADPAVDLTQNLTLPPEEEKQKDIDPYEQAQFQMWQRMEQDKHQLEQQRRTALQSALNADLTVNAQSNPVLQGAIQQTATNEKAFSPLEQANPDDYLPRTRTKPISPFEVKAGTVIPSVMLGGVNSDLPGQIMAQVDQNVFDTATGNHLLIPQGSKLVGSYDHKVVQGQKRVLIVWQRIIYPDASNLSLEGMPGADRGGYAGFSDKRNTHFWPTFRNALMLSAITAGVQLSQPRPKSGDYSYSSQQVIASSLGMQMNNVGMNTIMRNMNYTPTLTIRPGYVFHVMVTKDIILPPWCSSIGYAGAEE